MRRGQADLAAMRMALEALEKGYIFGIAPEGTRSKSRALLRANPGIVSLALHSGAPLIPVAHWGGEEFLVVLPGVGRESAAMVAERMRLAMEASGFEPDPGAEIRVTASIGVASVDPGSRQSLDALVQAADEALYRAKAAGRNRVEQASNRDPQLAEEPPSSVEGRSKADVR